MVVRANHPIGHQNEPNNAHYLHRKPHGAHSACADGAPKTLPAHIPRMCTPPHQPIGLQTNARSPPNGPEGVARRRASWRLGEENGVVRHLNKTPACYKGWNSVMPYANLHASRTRAQTMVEYIANMLNANFLDASAHARKDRFSLSFWPCRPSWATHACMPVDMYMNY